VLNLIDTHSHIHNSEDFDISINEIITNAKKANINKIITVGTDVEDSKRALELAREYEQVYVTVGIHPNVYQDQSVDELENLIIQIKESKNASNLVGLGDIGLDYHYKPFDRLKQIKWFEGQLELALKYNLPVSFHVREAFKDFWPIFDEFNGLKGTLHSYTDNLDNMQKALERDLYISVNGIITFNNVSELNKVFIQLPLNRVIFETDAPYLAPKPYRGKKNQPAYVDEIADYFAKQRGISLNEISEITIKNTYDLFDL